MSELERQEPFYRGQPKPGYTSEDLWWMALDAAKSAASGIGSAAQRPFDFAQRAVDAGGFRNLPAEDVGRESSLLGLSALGGGMVFGGVPKGAIAQNAASPELADVVKDLFVKGAIPGAGAGGAYAAVDGSDVKSGMMGGALFGSLGRGAWNVADDIYSKGLRLPGSGQGGQRGPTAGQPMNAAGPPQQAQIPGFGHNSAVDYPSYNALPQQAKTNNRDAYIAARALHGGELPPTATARGMRGAYDQSGVRVPITPNRVKNTNEAVNEFVRANGRQPMSSADWSQIFNSRTLSVPAAAGFGLGYGDGTEY